MNVLRFNSHADMQAYLIRAKADSLQGLHHNQAAIGYGDYWVRFIDIVEGVVEFGRVATLQEVADRTIDLGGTAEEAAIEVDATDLMMESGYVTGFGHSRYAREGNWDRTHKAHIWPIEESLFFQADECNYHLELLPLSGKVNLETAFRAYRHHIRNRRVR